MKMLIVFLFALSVSSEAVAGIKECSEAIADFGNNSNIDEKNIDAKCDHLSKEKQREAAEMASKKWPARGTCIEEKEAVLEGKKWLTLESVPCKPGQKSEEQIERDEESAQKRKCGKDYQRLRIGMKLTRLEDCVGATYETETVTEKGRVETYRTTFDWVHVKNGVVIGFTKRTD